MRRDDLSDEPLIYCVDDDELITELLERWLGRAGYACESFSDGPAMLHALRYRSPDAILLDLNMEGMQGDDVLRRVQASSPTPPVIFVTGEDRADVAVEIMRLGAWDYHIKPMDKQRLLLTLKNAVESYRLKCRVDDLEGRLDSSHGYQDIIGSGPSAQGLFADIRKVARTDVTAMILGESGTDKELTARAIHEASGRAKGPFVVLNCGAVTETLLESELFGHRKGAFTGASEDRAGRFEAADGGTLFLDEIAEMSPQAQVRLLRVLQDSRVTRVGDTREIPVDVRIVAATHRDLEHRIHEGLFREDLYYRLMVFPLDVPPLRDRIEDLPALVAHFIERHRKTDTLAESISDEALAVLRRHAWPGNVRELENLVQFALVTAESETIGVGDLPRTVTQAAPGSRRGLRAGAAVSPAPAMAGPDAIIPMEELERRAIVAALEATEGNVSLAARRLGLGRTTMYRKMTAFGLQ